jgi:3-hydroxybutyryl-CoA dehydrogenase
MSQRVAVVGAGLMGSGIAQVAAQAGFQVVLRDITDDALTKGMAGIEQNLMRLVEKNTITTNERDSTLSHITTSRDLDALADANVVIEAIFEHVEAKQELFRELDRICRNDAVLGSNTSAIPITTIASVTSRPEAVVGTHFFSPVPVMELCELVRGRRTSDATLAAARAFAESLGKTCVVVNRDVAGFVTTRLISAFVVEAVRLYEAGVASAEDIDTACRLGFGHRMGPLATIDLTGVDVLRHATANIYQETGDPKFFPPETLTRMVAAGQLGRKSGQGFYTYS